MSQHTIANVTTALAEGQMADDAALLAERSIDWGAHAMAAHYTEQWWHLVDRLRDDAIAEAELSGVELDLQK